MIKPLLLLACVYFSIFANAAGTIQIKGKVRSFDKQFFELTDGPYIYKIDRKIMASIKNLKADAEMEVWIPFSAIKDIKAIDIK